MRRNNRRSKGSALILSVLVMLGLITLGMVMMHHVVNDATMAGQLRATEQARYVAETGLHTALMSLQAHPVELLTRVRTSPSSTLVFDSNGQFVERLQDGSEGTPKEVQLFEPFQNAPLGSFSGVPSYKVTIDGFRYIPVSTGSESGELARSGEGYCHVEVTAVGYIASVALPTEAQWASDAGREGYAQYVVKAAVPLGPMAIDAMTCRRY